MYSSHLLYWAIKYNPLTQSVHPPMCYETDSFSRFVDEMLQYFIIIKYMNTEKSRDSLSHFPNKLKSHWFLEKKLANTNLRKIPFAHFPPGAAKCVQI